MTTKTKNIRQKMSIMKKSPKAFPMVFLNSDVLSQVTLPMHMWQHFK